MPYVCLHARTQVQRDRQTDKQRGRERRRETTEKTGLIEKDCLDLNLNYYSSYKSNRGYRTQTEVEEIVVAACKSIRTLNVMHKGIG